MITDTTRRLLGIPDTFVDDVGGITLTSWWPLISEAARALPGGVVEIGADKGFTTRMLAALCSELGSQFVSVDPAPATGVDNIAGVDHRRITSEDFFKGSDIPASPVWIVDGDHNYDTVAMELEGIVKATGNSDCLIFLHDLGWPNGRRDFWYSTTTAPADAPRMADGFGVSIDSEGVVPIHEGIGLGSMAAVAPREGGLRNGVLTAVEDFLKSESGQGWVFRWTPIFFGFGILVRESTLLSGKLSALVERFDAFDRVSDVLGPLEFNRLRLLQTTNVKWTESAAKDHMIGELQCRSRQNDEIRVAPLWTRIRYAFKLLKGC